MIRFRYPLIAAVVVAAVSILMIPAQSAAEDEQPLIKLLQSDAPKAEKAVACKKLAVWGSAKAVPALAALLPDPELTSWARIPLEAIPGPTASKALRDAMGNVSGLTLIGVINSLAVRRDAQAVDGLVQHMKGSDAEVASAAAAALGRIGNQAAMTALRPMLATAPETVRSAVAEGCILCAEKLLAAGDADAAGKLYDEVRAADVPKQRIVEATRGAILARGADGIPLLVEQLKSSDKVMVALGLTTARELSGPGVSRKLVTALRDVKPQLQALLILAMADRGDADAMPAMLEASKSGPSAVRIAAIKVLKSIGDASCVPMLLSIAAENDKEVAQTAKETLKMLPGKGVDADLVARLDNAKGAGRLALIELIGMRRIDAVPPLLKAADDRDPKVRAAAMAALGEVAKLENVPVLITRVVSPADTGDAAVALKALQAACIRMPDREACAAKLATALPKAPDAAQLGILETLTQMGGKKALQTVAEAAQSDDAELQDAATRLLGSWMSVDAGPVLLQLAQVPDGRFKVRALRGYIRLVRQFLMPDSKRAAMCRSALEAAERDEERALVLEVVERYPSVDMLRMAVAASKNPKFKDDLTVASLAVAKQIGGADPKQLVALIDQAPVKIEILKAEYGAGNKQKDVTAVLRRNVRDCPLIVLSAKSYNEAFGGDPVPSVVKKLKVQYRMGGKVGQAEFAENATIILPAAR